MKEKEIVRLKTKIAKIEAESDKLRAKIDGAKAPKKPAAKKSTAKKAEQYVISIAFSYVYCYGTI